MSQEITWERYQMLKEATKKGADLAPVDFESMRRFELAEIKGKLEQICHHTNPVGWEETWEEYL